MAGHGPLTVMSWKDFIANPSSMHGLFHPTPGQIRYDPNRVMVMLPDGAENTSDKAARVLNVSTLDELMHIKSEMLGKPILWRSRVQHRLTRNYAVIRVTTIWKGDFAVLLNPLNPRVAEILEQKFHDAELYILAGEKFCIELDIKDALEYWYVDMLDSQDLCGTGRTTSQSTRIYITNDTPYQHCFDCNMWWCLFCSPCWCLSAPCYMIHRSTRVKDMSHMFGPRDSITFRTALNSGHVLEISPEHQVSAVSPQRRQQMQGVYAPVSPEDALLRPTVPVQPPPYEAPTPVQYAGAGADAPPAYSIAAGSMPVTTQPQPPPPPYPKV